MTVTAIVSPAAIGTWVDSPHSSPTWLPVSLCEDHDGLAQAESRRFPLCVPREGRMWWMGWVALFLLLLPL